MAYLDTLAQGGGPCHERFRLDVLGPLEEYLSLRRAAAAVLRANPAVVEVLDAFEARDYERVFVAGMEGAPNPALDRGR